jgi:hypothetical protein
MYSRYTAAAFIADKEPDTVLRCIMQNWICVFGVMGGIHSDIGGEFSNDMMEDVAHKLGIKCTTTASYSPHQNGLNEKNHAVVDRMIAKMMESDKTLSPDMALRWALNAKNSLDNCHGYSPYQLHIGINPVMPSVTRDGPAAYENETKSVSFASNLNAMHSAREEFIKAESSGILKKALKSRLYSGGGDIENGDWIYYKKTDGKSKNIMWSGPSQVTAINGKKLFIDRGARLATVNRDDAVKVGDEFWNFNDQTEKKENKGERENSADEKQPRSFNLRSNKAQSKKKLSEKDSSSDDSQSSEDISEDETSEVTSEESSNENGSEAGSDDEEGENATTRDSEAPSAEEREGEGSDVPDEFEEQDVFSFDLLTLFSIEFLRVMQLRLRALCLERQRALARTDSGGMWRYFKLANVSQ